MDADDANDGVTVKTKLLLINVMFKIQHTRLKNVSSTNLNEQIMQQYSCPEEPHRIVCQSLMDKESCHLCHEPLSRQAVQFRLASQTTLPHV
jgi:hypothetical protein